MTLRRAESGARSVLIWLLLALSAALTWACWAASSPAGSSPDDDFHMASIWCADGAAEQASPGETCAKADGTATEGSIRRWIPRTVAFAECNRSHALVSASCLRDPQPGNTAQVANDGLYPPGFYAAMHPLASDSVTISVMWMRALNAALALLVFGLAFVVSEGGSRAALALTAGLAFVTPLSLFLVPSTNPTAWSMIGIGSLWLFVLAFMSTESTWRRWAALGGALVAWTMAVSARTDAPMYAALTVVAAAVVGSVGLRPSLKWVLPGTLVVASAVVFLTGAGSSVAAGGVAPSSADGHAPPQFVVDGVAYNTAHPLHLLISNIGHLWRYERDIFYTAPLGWVDTPMSLWGAIAAIGAFAVIAYALVTYRGWNRAAYALLVLAALALPLLAVQRSHLNIEWGYVQARYLYPLMLAVFGLGAYGALRHRALTTRRWVWPLSWVVMTVLASLALHIQIRRYISGMAVSDFDLNSRGAWWWTDFPLSPMALWLTGTLAMAVTIGLLLKIATGAAEVGRADD